MTEHRAPIRNVIPRFDGEFHFLSNFYKSPILFDVPRLGSVPFQSGEAAFQAAKVKAMVSLDPEERLAYLRKVLDAPTPAKAKYAGRSVEIDQEKWESIKVDCMREVVFEKFTQNKGLGEKLLLTRHALLVEGNDWGDTFWGRVDGKGSNVLGSLIMEVRGYLYWTNKRK